VRISKLFHLNRSQAELDFVDINTVRDTALFLDPHFLGKRCDPWSIGATRTLQSFFAYFLALLNDGNMDEARELFDHLHEPNETCLGLSKKRPQGRGVGEIDAERIFDSIASSRAVKTGVLKDLEDCRIFVHGIDKDKTSDMVTNIIRSHLITYTREQCLLWGIPLQPNSPSGFCWNAGSRTWENGLSDNLYVSNRRILLVPKAIVSYSKAYTPQQFHQHFVLNFFQNEHLRLRSALVRQRIRRGVVVAEYVTKKDVLKSGAAPQGDKDFLASFTKAHPAVFKNFKSGTDVEPISLEGWSQDVAEISAYLRDRLPALPPGRDAATDYHRTAVGILDFLFYPHLINPVIENEIHDGRKRIDIAFDNAAEEGFFRRLHEVSKVHCPFIFVECKNYANDPANPELDQMSGRFGRNRGQFGIVVCRSIEDHDLFLSRCRDTFRDGRGLILPLTDADLQDALDKRAKGTRAPLEDLLIDLHRAVVLP
jgi:hypothetical protein